LAVEVIVNDSSCLIDLRKGGLLTATLLLPFRFTVALPLVEAELNDFSSADWRDLRSRGMQVVDLDASQVERAFALKSLYPGLSAYDCFSLALAESTKAAMLLTGDRQLRLRATAIGVDVHGILWICDRIAEASSIPPSDLADALETLDADPLVFLPREEVSLRIESLRSRTRD
jgi:predicted nucleic acid-binding protein